MPRFIVFALLALASCRSTNDEPTPGSSPLSSAGSHATTADVCTDSEPRRGCVVELAPAASASAASHVGAPP